MYFPTATIVAALLGLTSAAPAIESRQFEAQLHFYGAAGTEYTISAPTSGNAPFTTGKFYLNKLCLPVFRLLTRCLGQSLAVDEIVLEGGATCTLFGIDGGSFTVVGANSVIVAPPQAITGGSCLAL